MHGIRWQHQCSDEAQRGKYSIPPTGADAATSTILMHQAIDEHGNRLRVASIVTGYTVVSDGPEVPQGLPQWFTERGERLALLCDSWFEVVGTQRKLRIIK